MRYKQLHWRREGETLESLLARVRESAVFVTEPAKKGSKRRKQHPLIAKAQALGVSLELMYGLLTGELTLHRIGESLYAVGGDGTERTFQRADGGTKRTVRDGRCSCPANRLNGLRCKHIKAAEVL